VNQADTLVDERADLIAESDARPTAEQLAAVEAERDARFTEDQIRALSADYTIGLNEAGNVQMKFNLFESADLQTFAPLTRAPHAASCTFAGCGVHRTLLPAQLNPCTAPCFLHRDGVGGVNA